MKTNQNILCMQIKRQVDLIKCSVKKADGNLKACITIPAHNEELFLPKTLKALNEQKDNMGQLLSKNVFEVTVLCHNCI